ncbi:MAG: hypothetical protein AB7G35_07315 [Hyphomicrobiaceae bacterium]
MANGDSINLFDLEISPDLDLALDNLAERILGEIRKLKGQPGFRDKSEPYDDDYQSILKLIDIFSELGQKRIPAQLRPIDIDLGDKEKDMKFVRVREGSIIVEFRWNSFIAKYRFSDVRRRIARQ